MSKQIQEFPDYEIDEYGIFNKHTGVFLKPSFYKSKFPMVSLRKRDQNGNMTDATRQDLRYDVLVANAFLTNPTNSTILNHKDGKLANCRPDNLEWKVNTCYRQYYLYYPIKEGKQFRVYNSDTKQITTMENIPNDKTSKRFYVTKPYENTDESLLQYVKDFEISVKQLREDDTFKFDYTFAYNHNVATMNLFHQTCKGKFEDHQKQEPLEYYYSKKCNNQAPRFCLPGTYQCYGYDYSFNHGTIMATNDMLIPTRPGKEHYLEELPKQLRVGYYHVKITTDFKDIAKVFYFSKENWYTNIMLQWAIENKKQFKFKFELVDDDLPNAYLYRTKDCVPSHTIFDEWYNILTNWRIKYPKNILVKFMCSSLHGQLARANTFDRTKQQVKDEGLDICYSDDADYKIIDLKSWNFGEKEFYKLLKNDEPYKHNIRLQSFLMSECVIRIAKLVMHDMDNVVRIHTDNVTFQDVDPKFQIDGLKPESKTSGLLKWFHDSHCEIITECKNLGPTLCPIKGHCGYCD